LTKPAKTGRTHVRPCEYSFLGHFNSNTLFGRCDTLKQRHEIEVNQKEPLNSPAWNRLRTSNEQPETASGATPAHGEQIIHEMWQKPPEKNFDHGIQPRRRQKGNKRTKNHSVLCSGASSGSIVRTPLRRPQKPVRIWHTSC